MLPDVVWNWIGELGVLETQKQEFSEAMHEHLLSARALYEKQRREAAAAVAAAEAAEAEATAAEAAAAEAAAAGLQQQVEQQHAHEPMLMCGGTGVGLAEGAAAAPEARTTPTPGAGPESALEELAERNDPRTLVSVLRLLRGLLEVLPCLELSHVLRSLHDSLVCNHHN